MKKLSILLVMMLAVISITTTCWAYRGGFDDNSYNNRSGHPHSLTYRAHVASLGWSSTCSEDQIAGTTGEGKAIEAVRIKFENNSKRSLIRYRVYANGLGWSNWEQSGRIAGTTGESRAIGAIQIQLEGNYADKYDVYYRVHVAKAGWIPWRKNGETAGINSYNEQIEAIRIKIEPKR